MLWSQFKSLGWLSPLTAWLCNRQLGKLAALGILSGRKDPEMPPESWLNTRISGNVMVIKYPCFSRASGGEKEVGGLSDSWGAVVHLCFQQTWSTKHWPPQLCAVLGKDHFCSRTIPASAPFCSSSGKRSEFHVSRETHMINFFSLFIHLCSFKTHHRSFCLPYHFLSKNH